MIVIARAKEFRIVELNTLALPGTVIQSEANDEKYAMPALRRTIGTNHAAVIRMSANTAETRCPFRSENSSNGARNTIDDGRNPPATPSAMAAAIPCPRQHRYPTSAEKNASTI